MCTADDHRELIANACRVALSRIDFTTSGPLFPDLTIDINTVPSTNRFCLPAPKIPPDPYSTAKKLCWFQIASARTGTWLTNLNPIAILYWSKASRENPYLITRQTKQSIQYVCIYNVMVSTISPGDQDQFRLVRKTGMKHSKINVKVEQSSFSVWTKFEKELQSFLETKSPQ